MFDRSSKPDADHFADQLAERPLHLPDLGNEPPLDPSGLSTPHADRRAVSFRWLSGSILTGISGFLLLGAAIYVSIESDAAVLDTPEMMTASLRSAAGAHGGIRPVVSTRKADKLVRFEVVSTAKQSFKAPMTLRTGEREVIKVRPFVHISTGLSMTTGQYATDIPPFNPLKLFTEGTGSPERAAEAAPDPTDAEVSITKADLVSQHIDKAPALSDAEAIAQIEEERRLSSEAGKRPALPLPPQLLLSRSLRQPGLVDGLSYGATSGETPFSKIEVRVVPENVTSMSKADAAKDILNDERALTLKKGETIEQLLRANGASNEQIRAILAALWSQVKVSSLTEGQRVRLLIAPNPAQAHDKGLADKAARQIIRVMLLSDSGITAIAAMDDRGVFVSVAPPKQNEQVAADSSEEDEDEDDSARNDSPRLYESLYETGLKNNLPESVIEELIRVFAYDVDFERHVSPNDKFEIFFSEDDENANKPEILYASLTVNGEARTIYRYQSVEDGTVEYFDQDGKSLKKFLLRKPIAAGELRSGFGMRYHPILRYSRLHAGVDWSAKIGTPIFAAGNGVVTKAGWSSGYGRHTEVKHANGYVTTYSHQSAFAKGITEGARVRQGQVIGYLGSSGLSTGPHLHYEVLVNGHFVNPMRIKIPRGRELDGRALAEFKRQREQTDALLTQAKSPMVAQNQ